jgi:hypothetical protein
MTLGTFLKKHKYSTFTANYGSLERIPMSGKELLIDLESDDENKYGTNLKKDSLNDKIVLDDNKKILRLNGYNGIATNITLYSECIRKG